VRPQRRFNSRIEMLDKLVGEVRNARPEERDDRYSADDQCRHCIRRFAFQASGQLYRLRVAPPADRGFMDIDNVPSARTRSWARISISVPAAVIASSRSTRLAMGTLQSVLAHVRDQSLDERERELLPVEYAHRVFTLPHAPPGWVCSANGCSDPLFQPSARRPSTWPGAEAPWRKVGFSAPPHTWGRVLIYEITGKHLHTSHLQASGTLLDCKLMS
jgi:hypothetical protein